MARPPFFPKMRFVQVRCSGGVGSQMFPSLGLRIFGDDSEIRAQLGSSDVGFDGGSESYPRFTFYKSWGVSGCESDGFLWFYLVDIFEASMVDDGVIDHPSVNC